GGSLELELTTSLFAQGAEAAAQFASRETATPPQLRIEGGVTPAVSTTAAPTTSAPPTTTPPTTTPPTTAPPPPPPVSGALYVDSASGNDANAGTSPAAAWRTLAHVSGAALNAGGRHRQHDPRQQPHVGADPRRQRRLRRLRRAPPGQRHRRVLQHHLGLRRVFLRLRPRRRGSRGVRGHRQQRPPQRRREQ